MTDWTEGRIFDVFKSILVEALEIEPGIIHPDSMIMKELGAEAIDILDIAFRIETAFHINIPEQAFSVKPEDIPKGKNANEILTVRLILDFIKDKLEGQ